MLNECGDAKPLGFVINVCRIEEITKIFWLCFGEKDFLVDIYTWSFCLLDGRLVCIDR